MECRYAPSAVQLMGHALFSLSLPSLSHWSHPLQPSSVGTLVWICQEHPPPTRRLEEGTVLRPRELHAARRLAQVCTHQIQAIRNADDGFNLILSL